MTAAEHVVSSLWRRLRRVVSQRGWSGLLRVLAERVVGLARKLRPAVRAQIREREKRAAAFDRQFGVDTRGVIHPTEMAVANPNLVHAVSYGGSDPDVFRKAIAALPIDYSQFVFLDFGSGKGRAILLATEFPFKRIIGIEFAEALHQIAQANIETFQRRAPQRTHVESVCMDAVEYPLPDACLVCYFCNPFDAMLMAKVLSGIQESLLRAPREIFIVYYNPKQGHLLDQSDCFKAFEVIDNVRIWRTAVKPGGSRLHESAGLFL